MDHLPPEEPSVRELFERMRKLAGSHDLLERLKVLWVAAELGARLERCTDAEIADLLSMVQERLGLFGPDFAVCEHAKRRLLESSAEIPEREWRAIRDAGVELLNAEAALFRSGIPHMLLPFQRDRFASNGFLVPQLTDARACLLRCGFRSMPQAEAVLVDSETDRAIRLVEAGQGAAVVETMQ
jgi:hypothetical protein